MWFFQGVFEGFLPEYKGGEELLKKINKRLLVLTTNGLLIIEREDDEEREIKRREGLFLHLYL